MAFGIDLESTFKFFLQNFDEYLGSSPDNFLNSPTYYWVTSRKGAFIHEGNRSFLVTCISPHDDNCILVFPEIGDGSGNLSVFVLNQLVEVSKEYVVRLARYDPSELKKIHNILVDTLDNQNLKISTVTEESLDWRYPAHILSTEQVAKLQGSTYQKIRTRIRYAQKHIEYRRINRSKDFDLAMQVVYNWGSKLQARYDSFEFYEKLLDATIRLPDVLQGMLFLLEKKTVGFCIWENTDSKTSNSLANLADSKISGLAEYQMVMMCKFLSDNKIEYLNLGGSETKGLDTYKLKYRPVSSLRLLSAKVVCSADMHIRTSKQQQDDAQQNSALPQLPFGHSHYDID